MRSRTARIAGLMLLLALLLALPSFVLPNGRVAAQPISTPTPTDESISSDGPAPSEVLPEQPFPDAPWQQTEAQAVLDALKQGENPQSNQQPAALITEAQLQAAPAASTRIFLPRVSRGTSSVPPTRTPTPKPDDGDDDDDTSSADVGVGIWPNPSVQVFWGGTIAYELRASNFGKGTASSVQVKLPYKKSQMEIYGSTIPGKNDWVSEVTDKEVTFTFGPLNSGEQRKATLFFRLKSGMSLGTILPMQGSYSWNGGSGRTNYAPVKVANVDERSAWATLTVSPASVKPNATQRFSTDRYAPGEGISFWLNLPDGSVRALNETAVADSQGRMTIDIRFKDLPAGNYSLVGQGRRSGVVGVGLFSVTR